MDISQFRGPREGLTTLVCMVLGLSLALSFLLVRYIGRSTDFGDAATMGIQTVSVFASSGEYQIHCQVFKGDENCIEGMEARGAKNQIIWFGNSQLHAINQYHPGGQNAPALLSAKLAQRGFDLVTFSQGNANLQEHYVIFEYLRSRVPFKQLVLSAVFDDLREDSLREGIVDLLLDKRFRTFLSQSDFGEHLATKYEPHEAEKAFSPQDYVEGKLNDALTKWLPVWAARPEMRADILIGLYRLRNTVFGITPNTKRKMIPGRYGDNMAALEALLKSAANAGISVLIYVAPVGVNNGERPYVDSEYQRFKGEVETLAKRHGARYQNLEDLIPEPLWGQKASTGSGNAAELDFMHFTSAGHAVLADRIDKLLRDAGPIDRSKHR
jgi:hypothetical protein